MGREKGRAGEREGEGGIVRGGVKREGERKRGRDGREGGREREGRRRGMSQQIWKSP